MEKNFEQMLNELESLIKDLENNDIDLEESINKYKKALDLSKSCKEALDKAKLEVEIKE